MTYISNDQIVDYVEAHIDSFHNKKVESINRLKLDSLLKRKNPYLFKSKNINTVAELIRSLLDAYLSSQEETLFGAFLEGLAIYVAETVHNGWKSSATGIDLEFVKNGTRYIVSIKSGPNWGNSSQIIKMKDNFNTATRVIRQGNTNVQIVAVNGCCYGRDSKPDKGSYFKFCGQKFWELISNDADFYIRIIEPLGHSAKQHNDTFVKNYEVVIAQLSKEFAGKFCDEKGEINWNKIAAFSSSAEA